MELRQKSYHFTWILLVLQLVATQASTDDKPQMQQDIADIKTQLNTLQNSIQSVISKVEYLENSVPNIEQSLKACQCDLTKQDLHTEFQSLKNRIYALVPSLKTCATALQATGKSGVYHLNITNIGLAPFDAYCLKDPNGWAPWTVIQRRQDGSVSFYRNWRDYKNGFGDPSGEYWLGLEKIYAMTSNEKYELWIELGDHEGERRHANYADFEIGNEEENYYLKELSDYSGDAGNEMDGTKFYKMNFTTFDKDNDAYIFGNCAEKFRNAWWYWACGSRGLNGEYNNNQTDRGINWWGWHGSQYSFKYTHMAIRPVE